MLIYFLPTHGQTQSSNSLAPGHYIVVAAYKLGQDSYAQNYLNRIKGSAVKANYGADEGRKYLYVYLDYFTDFDESIAEMLATRKKEGFEQAWVRVMKGEPLPPLVKIDEVTKKDEPSASTAKEEVVAEQKMETKSVPQEAVKEVVEKTVDNIEEIAEVAKEEEDKEEAITEPKVISESSVYLSLYNSTNNNQIDGEVEIIDTERARLISKMKGNQQVQLPDPKSKSGRITLLANVFGYRPLQHEINFQQIPSDTMQHYMEWAGNHYIVKFDLVRYHKGDINTLYNVYFYNDAAIMLPESRYQLNSLLQMLNENPNYRIMLHGHTNGNARGRLITIGPSQSFFSLADDVKDGTGTAKELSRERAEVIKSWLVAEGIAADRIEIKAWGGGRMLHDKHSVNAKKNVRVDVEILAE